MALGSNPESEIQIKNSTSQILLDLKTNKYNMNLGIAESQKIQEIARSLACLDQKIHPFIGAQINSESLQNQFEDVVFKFIHESTFLPTQKVIEIVYLYLISQHVCMLPIFDRSSVDQEEFYGEDDEDYVIDEGMHSNLS